MLSTLHLILMSYEIQLSVQSNKWKKSEKLIFFSFLWQLDVTIKNRPERTPTVLLKTCELDFCNTFRVVNKL